jgi:SAM-dependent methyltransferase
MSSKFERFVPLSYDLIKPIVSAIIKPEDRILDLGPFEGNMEDFIDNLGGSNQIEAVEIDEAALKVLSAKSFANIKVNPIHMDANDYLRECDGQFDLVLSSASIHEMNDPSNQETYLNWFFARINQLLSKGGKVIIGDLYFPAWIPDDEVDAFRKYQWETIKHASERREFVFPELIDAAASQNGFALISKKEIRAVKEIDRRYYVLVFEKL